MKKDDPKLGKICKIYQPKTISKKDMNLKGKYLVFGANGIIGRYDKYNHEDQEVLLTCRGATCGSLNISQPKSWITGNAMVIKPKTNDILKKYIFLFLNTLNFKDIISGSAQPQITRKSLESVKIILPDLPTQRKIVKPMNSIMSIQENLSKCEKLLEEYQKAYFKSLIDPEWEKKSLGEVCETGRGRVISKKYIQNNKGEYPVYSSGTKDNGILGFINTYDFNKELITWTTDGANAGTVFYRKGKFSCTNVCGIVELKKEENHDLKYLSIVLNNVAKKYVNPASGIPKLMNKEFEQIQIPLPKLEIQKEIVEKMDEIESLKNKVTNCRELFEEYKNPLFKNLLNKYKVILDQNEEERKAA